MMSRHKFRGRIWSGTFPRLPPFGIFSDMFATLGARARHHLGDRSDDSPPSGSQIPADRLPFGSPAPQPFV